MVAMIETAPSETLHSNSRAIHYHICAEANSRRSTTGERNVKLVTVGAIPYALRHVAQSSDLHRTAARQIVPDKYADKSHTRRGGPVIAESQNPNGLRKGFGMATYTEHERYRGVCDWVGTLNTLPLPSPTSPTVCGAEQYAVASESKETATDVQVEEKGARPWSEDV
jgi:hypothetical protein